MSSQHPCPVTDSSGDCRDSARSCKKMTNKQQRKMAICQHHVQVLSDLLSVFARILSSCSCSPDASRAVSFVNLSPLLQLVACAKTQAHSVKRTRLCLEKMQLVRQFHPSDRRIGAGREKSHFNSRLSGRGPRALFLCGRN